VSAPQAFDRRLTPAREDLAALHLKGKVAAPRYVEGVTKRVVAPSAALRRAPRGDEGLQTELLHGEAFTVYDEREGWAWGQSSVDGYVGYVPADALRDAAVFAPTHAVAVPRTLVFPTPDVKLTPLFSLSLDAKVAVVAIAGTFARLSDGGYAVARHLMPKEAVVSDIAGTATQLLGVPYLWGGRTSLGLDCSGLIQLALARAGFAAPRDCDLQEKEIGTALDLRLARKSLKRGDLVFWADHGGIMLDAATLIHANAFHMAVAIEPLAEAEARIAPVAGPLRTVRRLAALARTPGRGGV
jgi:cell wall-associated NlpC family hydrolase